MLEKEQRPDWIADIERFIFLSQTDNLWKEHLQAIRFLQQAVGLRGYAQRDPLTEFKLEAYNLFLDMQVRKRRNTIYTIYICEPVDEKAAEKRVEKLKERLRREKEEANRAKQISNQA